MLWTMELVKRLGETVPLYRLSCNMAPEAAPVAFRGVFGGGVLGDKYHDSCV